MNRAIHGLLSVAFSAFAWGASEPSNTTSTTWEIYGVVAAVLILVLVGIFWQFKIQDKQQKPRARKLA